MFVSTCSKQDKSGTLQILRATSCPNLLEEGTWLSLEECFLQTKDKNCSNETFLKEKDSDHGGPMVQYFGGVGDFFFPVTQEDCLSLLMNI